MKRFSGLCLCLVLFGFALAAGSFGAAPLTVQSVTFSKTEGGPAVTAFRPTDRIFYAAVKLNRVEAGLKVKTVWSAVDTTAGKDIEIARKEFTGLVLNLIKAQVELPRDWPTGKYKLDIFLNGALGKTAEFLVQ
jgi:hypothetical protein